MIGDNKGDTQQPLYKVNFLRIFWRMAVVVRCAYRTVAQYAPDQQNRKKYRPCTAIGTWAVLFLIRSCEGQY